jgi:hypothetical protein
LGNAQAKAVLVKHVPGLLDRSELKVAAGFTLDQLAGVAPNVFTEQVLRAIAADLAALSIEAGHTATAPRLTAIGEGDVDASSLLRGCLDDLEERIDPEVEDRLMSEWEDFAYGRFEGPFFDPKREAAAPAGIDWPEVSINAALEDDDAMCLQQYGFCSAQLATGSGLLLNVRANYGTSIIPLLYGVEPFVMDEELDTLPTSQPFNDVDAIKRLLDAGVPDIYQGYGAKVLEMGRRYTAIAEQYPKIGKYVHIYHPDLQGPMDICEVVWGSSIFYALYDQPDLVKALLELVTETYIRFMKAWIEVVPFREGGNAHWGLYHRGSLMIRDDSAMNLSLDMVQEYIRPYDQRLLKEFGGGAIHFCGKGDHYAPMLAEMEGLYAVNLSQPEYNDMERIYANTVDRGISIIGLRQDAAEQAVARGRDLRGRVHVL